MPNTITCQICDSELKKRSMFSHLGNAHSMTPDEYAEQYGEYRDKFLKTSKCKKCGNPVNKKNKYCSYECRSSDTEYKSELSITAYNRGKNEKATLENHIRCPLCDLQYGIPLNKNFSNHIRDVHGKNMDELFKIYPHYEPIYKAPQKPILDKNVKCLECGKMLSKITSSHLRYKHDMTIDEYRIKHGIVKPGTYINKIPQLYPPKPKQEFLDMKANGNVQCKVCDERFDTEFQLGHHITKKHKLEKIDYVREYVFKNEIQLCECGCGEEVNLIEQPPYRRRFMDRHSTENGMTGRNHKKESKEKMRKSRIKYMSKITTDTHQKDTNIELKIKSMLDKQGIKYIPQEPVGIGICDFYLPEKDMYIEVDGKYWHPRTLVNMKLQVLDSPLRDDTKNKSIPNLIRIHEDDVDKIKTYDDMLFYNYRQDYSVSYRQPIIAKETLMKKNYQYGKGYEYKLSKLPILLQIVRRFISEFPYPPSDDTLEYLLSTLNKNISKPIDKVFSNTVSSTGNIYLKSKFKSYWKTAYKGNPSPYDAYFDDKILTEVIKYRIGLNNSGETFDFSPYQIINGLSARRLTVSFFKPQVAANIYSYFLGTNKTPTVIDPSAGFGGRMLGFKSVYPNGKYIGIEPNIDTYNELVELSKNFDNVELHNCKLEDYNGSKECDLTFTSIPYYDTEIYSNHIKYYSLEHWKDTFIESLFTFKNKLINVSDKYRHLFPKDAKEYFLKNNTSHYNKSKKEKYEYILEF